MKFERGELITLIRHGFTDVVMIIDKIDDERLMMLNPEGGTFRVTIDILMIYAKVD